MKKIIALLLILPLIGFSQEHVKQSKRIKFPDYRKPQPHNGCTFALKGEYLRLDYSKYIPLLGSYNDSINDVDGTGQLETGYLFKRHYISIGYGWSSREFQTDSLDGYFNNNIYTLNYGYNVLNTWRFTVRPTVAFKFNHSRLLNTEKGGDEFLSEYLKNRDLDIRFNQPVGYAGLDVSYNVYGHKQYNLSSYWKFGIYAGYAFKIVPAPIVRSQKTRLHHVPELGLDQVCFGFYFSWNVEWD